MTERSSSERGGVDGVGCVATLLVLLLIVFVVSTVLGRGGQVEEAEATAVSPALVAVTATSTQTAVPSFTHTPTNTATPTQTGTPTQTALPPATSTLIPTVTETAVPPTDAPPTATFSPTVTPTLPPLPTPSGTYSWTLKVPILMYHYISIPPEDADVYRTDLSVAPKDFRAQMQYLADNGFTTIDLYDLSLAITAKIELPEKPVIITMDDGYLDNYTEAFPILQEFGQKATFFIVTEFVDFGREGYMTWPMIEEMAAAGMRMEPHSRTHPDLRERDPDFLVWEILGPQETLAAHIGYPPRFFAYPGGSYDEDTIAMLRELDFWGAVVTAGGKWHGFNDRYEWTRVRMRNTTHIAEFADFVDAGDHIGGKPPGG